MTGERVFLVVVCFVAAGVCHSEQPEGGYFRLLNRGNSIPPHKLVRRSPIRGLHHLADHQLGMMENFMSKLIFENLNKACKTNSSVVEEIVACYRDNEGMMEMLLGELGQKCVHEDADKHLVTHMDAQKMKLNVGFELRELICDHWRDFDQVCSCAYMRQVAHSHWKVMKKLIRTKVEVGTCFVTSLARADEKVSENLVRNRLEKICQQSNGEPLNEIANCLAKHEYYADAMASEQGGQCFKETFKMDYKANDIAFLKDVVCNKLDKFQELIGCTFTKISQGLNQEDLDTITKGFTNMGFCLVGISVNNAQ